MAKAARFLRNIHTGVIVGWQRAYEGRSDLEAISEAEVIRIETGKDPAPKVAKVSKKGKAKKSAPKMKKASGSAIATQDFNPADPPPTAEDIVAALKT